MKTLIRLSVIFPLFVLIMGCASTAKTTRQLITISDIRTFDWANLVSLAVTEGPESTRPRTTIRVSVDQEVDLYMRGVDQAGNLYTFPREVKATWTVASPLDHGQVSIGVLNQNVYPERVYDGATSELIQAQVIRLAVKDPGAPTPVMLEMRMLIRSAEGTRAVVGRFQLEVI